MVRQQREVSANRGVGRQRLHACGDTTWEMKKCCTWPKQARACAQAVVQCAIFRMATRTALLLCLAISARGQLPTAGWVVSSTTYTRVAAAARLLRTLLTELRRPFHELLQLLGGNRRRRVLQHTPEIILHQTRNPVSRAHAMNAPLAA